MKVKKILKNSRKLEVNNRQSSKAEKNVKEKFGHLLHYTLRKERISMAQKSP